MAKDDAAPRQGAEANSGGPLPRLTCTAGPRAGVEFDLGASEVTVGRSSDNAISIPDTSVSRKHAIVKQVAHGWIVVDLGSENGTRVNGRPISAETPLADGDVIGVGDTQFSFSASGGLRGARTGRPRPTRGPRGFRGAKVGSELAGRRRRKRLIIGVCAGLGLVAVIGGFQVARVRRAQRADAVEAAAQAQRAKQALVFQEGKNRVRAGDWVSAKEKFDELARLNPSYPSLKEYLEVAAREIPNQQYLKTAEDALLAHRLGEARAALDHVGADTQLYERVRTARAKLADEVAARLNEAIALRDAAGSHDAAKMTQLDELTTDVLAAAPDNATARDLNKQAKDALADIARRRPEARTDGPQPWLEVSARFRAGDLKNAQLLANACAAEFRQCKELFSELGHFGESFTRLESLEVPELQRLVELDARLSNRQGVSAMGKQVATRLVGALYISAASAKQTGDWARAAELARRILKLDAAHSGAQAIDRDVRGRARGLWEQCYVTSQSNPEEALKHCRDCATATPKDDEFHAKCELQVKKLQP